MALNIHKKEKIIRKINKIANSALSVILSEVQNIPVNNITQLRQLALKSEVKINIVKNTLLKLAIQNTPFQCLTESIKGPNMIAFSMQHPGSAAKLLKNFKKINAHCKIKVGVFEDKLLSLAEINELANMPTYVEAVTRVIIGLQEITVVKFIRLLHVMQHNKLIINT